VGDKTKIQWADATWNPVVGCSKVSEGCRNCYAFDLHTMRHKAKLDGKQLPEQYAKPFSEIQLFPDRLEQPLRWKRPRKIFVNSLSDLFHPDVPFDFIRAVWTTMTLARHHTFQVLTKRPQRALEFFQWMRQQEWGVEETLPNVWFGVTVENQQAADERIPLLLQTPAAIRWLSVEPMVGNVNLNSWMTLTNRELHEEAAGMSLDPMFFSFNNIDPNGRPLSPISWVVCGGESGSKARPMHPDWARSLRDQCETAGVPFFFKQWGEWLMVHPDRQSYEFSSPPEKCMEISGSRFYRVGRDKAGRLLDGKLWDQYPNI
jgi:protein gp37